MAQAGENQSSPPYILPVASVGGEPTIDQDIPALAVFIFLYLTGTAANMTIFQINRRKGHKFMMLVAMSGFCISRVATCVLRLVWATRPTNIRVAIAAQILTNVGILIVYIIALILAQRILRAMQPRLGWHSFVGKTFRVLFALLLCAIILVITFTVLSFYTLNTNIISTALWVQRGALTYLLIFNLISLAMLLLSLLLPRSQDRESFGKGSMRSKMIVLGMVLCFCTLIAGFRAGTTWETQRPASDPAWYDSKAAFYVFGFTFEIVIIYLFLLTRFDRMFWVPDGSKKPGDFSRESDPESNKDMAHLDRMIADA